MGRTNTSVMVVFFRCVGVFWCGSRRNGLFFCFALFDVWIHAFQQGSAHAESYGVFFLDLYFFAGARIASGSCFLWLEVNGAEIAYLEATAADQMFGDIRKDDVRRFGDVLPAEAMPALIENLDKV